MSDLPDQSDMAYHMPFLEEMAAHSGVIIEIGLGMGVGSTRAFSRGLARTRMPVKIHIGVDQKPMSEMDEVPSDWHFVQGPSESTDTADKVAAILGDQTADLIFIDTHHTYEQLSKELPVWLRFAAFNTMWIFHDTWMFGVPNHMTQAIVDFCVAHPEWEYIEHSRESHGLGLMMKTATLAAFGADDE